MEVTAGPDGFLVTSEALDYPSQVLLSDYLRERQAKGAAGLESALSRFRKQLSKTQLVGLIRAIHARIAWIAGNERELSEPRLWQDFLAQLARNLYAANLPLGEGDLIALLEGHRKYKALWSFGPEELLVAFIATRDLPPELAAELRRYQADLLGFPGGMKHQSQASYQVAMQHVHLLLWHDENDRLDVSRCWSDRVRRDLRAMNGARRDHWKQLLRHIKGNAPAKPSKSWLKEADQRLRHVGLEDFRQCVCGWLAAFGSDQPQRLTVAGSHILRGLLWYAALAQDPSLSAAALRLLDGKWKSKRNIDKVMVALVAILENMPAAEAWPSLLRLEQEWPTTSVQVERFLEQTAAELGISEEELKARVVLRSKLEVSEQLAKTMEKLAHSRAMVRLPLPPRR